MEMINVKIEQIFIYILVLFLSHHEKGVFRSEKLSYIDLWHRFASKFHILKVMNFFVEIK